MVHSVAVLRERAAILHRAVESHITPQRVRRYLRAISEVNAPSTASAFVRGPVVESLLREDDLLKSGNLHYIENYNGTGNTVVLCGDRATDKSIWYFTHLDTVSYMIHPRTGDGYPLVPFCNHLMRDYECAADVYRYDFGTQSYSIVATGVIQTRETTPFFLPAGDLPLVPGDRVVLSVPYHEDSTSGMVTAHLDNAGAVAAALCAAPVLADAGISALIALTDEEEGPTGGENQMIGRGGARLAHILPQPLLSIVGDMQQAGGVEKADTHGGIENSTHIGGGAVLAEFSSLTRGAVTPPHVYVTAREYASLLREEFGVSIQESNNAYTSRSDDVSAMLRIPNVVLLGFPGVNRHCDNGLPQASLHDIVSLAKAFAYYGLMGEFLLAGQKEAL